MNIKQAFILALRSLRSSKLRAALTMLGIIIGVAAVIILVSLINGFSNSLKDNFASMGSNLINARITDRSSLRKVSEDDIRKLVSDNPTLFSSYSPVMTVSSPTVKYGDTNSTTTCTGTNETYSDIRALSLTEGNFLTFLDVDQHLNVCVIGEYLVTEFFGGTDPLGKTIKINGRQFTVEGVLAKTDSGTQGSGDDCVYIPFTTAEFLNGTNKISSYVITAVNTQVMADAVARLQAMLYDELGTTSSYTVSNSSTMIDRINSLTGTLTLVLVGIAGISLLVGGIGIMNIMVVSVTERTREIGIRMAVGAKGRDILSQFLIEAATTSAAGGVIGIILGVAASFPLSKLMGVTAAISIPSIIVAFSVSAGIGILFGFFPARKAAKMNPIDALRYD